MAQAMFPDEDYDEIMASEGSAEDHYKLGKNGVFALMYFGNEHTLATKYGIPEELGKPALEKFLEDYEGVKRAQARIIASFASITQPNGIGTKVYWKDPKDYVESLFGFKRYFTLENKICKALFNLAQSPPEYFKRFNSIKVKRRDKLQTPGGAVMSALYGASMQIQAAVVRAAGNHEIQSSGAHITKELQRELWTLQPQGIGPWVIRMMQVHDEVLAVTSNDEIQSETVFCVNNILDRYRSRVALIGMDWHLSQPSWAGKEK
jgi:DNA polymerase I-like protein with 3'-5' exonuclease and polymerase domains